MQPQRSEFEVRTNATYESLMWALSRPGLNRLLPAPGFSCIIDTLIDCECSVHTDDAQLAQHIALAGAGLTSAIDADHLFIKSFTNSSLLKDLTVGADLHPEEGATLVVNCKLGEGQALKLSGPGVECHAEIRIGQLPDDFWSTRDACSRYPLGFDIFFVDGREVLGLPRSTLVELI